MMQEAPAVPCDADAAGDPPRRNAPLVIATGFAGGRWGPLADQLLAALAGARRVDADLARWLAAGPDDETSLELTAMDGPPLAAAGESLAAQLAVIARGLPAARFVVFVDEPAMTLAQRLARGDEVEPVALLEQWCEQAQAFLRDAEMLSGRLLFVLADEAASAPRALRHACASELGASFGSDPPGGGCDTVAPLAMAVARGLLSEEARWLHAELVALCRPLADDEAGPGEIDPGDSAAAVVRAWHRQRAASAAEDGLRQEGGRLRQQLEQARGEASRARRLEADNAALHERAAQMLEELEYLHAEQLRRAAAPGRPAAGTFRAAVAAPAAKVILGEARLTPPHLELGLRIEAAVAGGRRQLIDARLVEHNGLPGLAIFEPAAHAVLPGATPDGTEDGRAFVLVIGRDRARLARLGTSAWSAMSALVQDLHAELARKPPRGFWAGTAARLLRDLAESANVFRCDAVQLSDDGQGVTIVAPSCSGLSVAALHLERVAGGVQLARRDTTAPLPLPSWPCEPGGAPQAIWLLPVGPGQGAAAKRAAWQRLAEAERALLLGLLALLAQGTPAGLSPEWTQGAQGWLRDARQHAEPPAWKRLARALRTRALGT